MFDYEEDRKIRIVLALEKIAKHLENIEQYLARIANKESLGYLEEVEKNDG